MPTYLPTHILSFYHLTIFFPVLSLVGRSVDRSRQERKEATAECFSNCDTDKEKESSVRKSKIKIAKQKRSERVSKWNHMLQAAAAAASDVKERTRSRNEREGETIE